MSLFYFLLIGGVNLLNFNIKKERRGKIDIDFLNRYIMCHCKHPKGACLHAEVPACGKQAFRHAGVAISLGPDIGALTGKFVLT